MRHQYGDTAGSCNKFVSINYQLCSAQHRMTLPHRGHYESASRLSRVSAALLISMTSASANRTRTVSKFDGQFWLLYGSRMPPSFSNEGC
jgi:hypothetical protein